MRVIAGSVGGIHLDAPKSGVRPTMDRVKAAIFPVSAGRSSERGSSIFAGTGSLGIEALSRGGFGFVRGRTQRPLPLSKAFGPHQTGKARPTAGCVRVSPRAQVPEQFRIVFADPPMKTKSGKSSPALARKRGACPSRALGNFRVGKRPVKSSVNDAVRVVRARRYGATEVLFLRRAAVAAQNRRPR